MHAHIYKNKLYNMGNKRYELKVERVKDYRDVNKFNLYHRRRELHRAMRDETPFINITFQGEMMKSKIFLPYEQAKILANSIFNILDNLSVSNQTTKVDETQNLKPENAT